MPVSVGVRELRAKLRAYLRRAAEGQEVVVTDRGRPLARIVGAGWQSTYDRLVAEGVITPAKHAWTPIREDELFDASGVLEQLLEDRRSSH